DVDVLTLSATPIPRTLHMALLGIRDISNLTTPPPGRLAIETKVARMDEVLVRETLRRELDRGGQCFLVHNRVFDLDVVAGTVMRDLELRGAGNLLGAQQSGHIASVGYDLYCRLLAEAVKAAKRDVPRPAEPATVDVELPCAIPESYVGDPRETFRWFRRIST